jgi:hypothetical protein
VRFHYLFQSQFSHFAWEITLPKQRSENATEMSPKAMKEGSASPTGILKINKMSKKISFRVFNLHDYTDSL